MLSNLIAYVILSCLTLTVGESAFSDWVYRLKFKAVSSPAQAEITINTSSLSAILQDLQPDVLYEVELSACGPVKCQPTQDKLVFSTKPIGKLSS